ncbi:hypothetical protein PTI98_009103 [Pleurotus ostreatus]|nr:hypothetical protein PTI98_009103 [Pleurotus ostreatus]
MYYNRSGKMVVAGAEAEDASIASQAEDEGWTKVELFKLRLRPSTMKLKMNGLRLASLPKHKTAVDVFGDFLGYLFKCTRTFFTDTHANGHALWTVVQHDLQFVLSHPNGREGAQQTKMRRAIVYGGEIPDTNEGKARIRFVTEGEASLHACVLAADVLSVRTNPCVRHGGLSSAFAQSTSNHGFLIAGSQLVCDSRDPSARNRGDCPAGLRRTREFLEEKLRGSKYGSADLLDHITKRFDETTKRLFRAKKDLQFITFGSPLDKDISEVADLFEPSIEAAVAAIKRQIEATNGLIESIWLVGGFAASPWLFHQLQESLAPVTVSRPDSQTSKAVADGAIGFYCDHHVSARMSKYTYGVEYLRELDANDPDHAARKSRLSELPSGPKLLPDAFDCILSRSERVDGVHEEVLYGVDEFVVAFCI